jgi:tellurite resistance protein TehA-like permease
MKESTKGMLLSGLVYPGLGQLILGRVPSGIVFVILATAGFIVLIYRIIQRAFHMIDQVLPLLADNKLDVITLKEMLSRDSAGGWGLETISLIVIAGSWLVAIGHAYFVGKKIDRQPG